MLYMHSRNNSARLTGYREKAALSGPARLAASGRRVAIFARPSAAVRMSDRISSSGKMVVGASGRDQSADCGEQIRQRALGSPLWKGAHDELLRLKESVQQQQIVGIC